MTRKALTKRLGLAGGIAVIAASGLFVATAAGGSSPGNHHRAPVVCAVNHVDRHGPGCGARHARLHQHQLARHAAVAQRTGHAQRVDRPVGHGSHQRASGGGWGRHTGGLHHHRSAHHGHWGGGGHRHHHGHGGHCW